MSKLKELRKAILTLDKLEATTKRNEKLSILAKANGLNFLGLGTSEEADNLVEEGRDIEFIGRYAFKKDNNKPNTYLKTLFKVCFEPCISYGITLSPKEIKETENNYYKNKDKRYKSSIKAFEDFLEIVDSLKYRELTGNSAKRNIKKLLSRTDPRISKWFARCLNKDLKAGISEGTYGVFYPDLVSDFGNALANNLYNNKTGIMEWERLEFPCIAEYKFDGMNITQIFEGEKYPITFGLEDQKEFSLSRSGIHYPIMDNIWNTIKKHILPDSFIVGEAYAKWDISEKDKYKSVWSKAMSLIKTGMTPKGFDPSKISEDKIEDFKKDFIYVIYEYASNSFFSKEHNYTCKVKRKIRRKMLVNLIKKINHPNIQLSYAETVHNIEEAKDFYKRSLKLGYEGAMFKNKKSYVTQSRNDDMLKAKPEIELDGIIYGIYKGTGRNSKWAGGINVYYPKLKAISNCNLRTDSQREEVWKHRDEYIGVPICILSQDEPNGNQVADASRFMKVKKDFPSIKELRIRTDLKKWPATKLTKYVNKSINFK